MRSSRRTAFGQSTGSVLLSLQGQAELTRLQGTEFERLRIGEVRRLIDSAEAGRSEEKNRRLLREERPGWLVWLEPEGFSKTNIYISDPTFGKLLLSFPKL